MTGFINVSSPANFVTLYVSTSTISSTSTAMKVASMQDISVSNANGTFRWKELGLGSQKVVATPATNSIGLNIVLDDDQFFGTVGSTGTTATELGIFELSNQKLPVFFRLYWNSVGTGKYVDGNGYLTGLAPKVNPDQPVWISPLNIEVNGNFTTHA